MAGGGEASATPFWPTPNRVTSVSLANERSPNRMSKVKAPAASLRPPFRVPGVLALGLTATVVLASVSSLAAQSSDEAPLRDSWTVTVLGGVLSYDPSR